MEKGIKFNKLDIRPPEGAVLEPYSPDEDNAGVFYEF